MSTVAMASLERSSLQMTAVVITQAEWLTCRGQKHAIVHTHTHTHQLRTTGRKEVRPPRSSSPSEGWWRCSEGGAVAP